MNIVDKLEIVNFRCHSKFSLEFPDQTTLIIGSNGSGKTSLIEAIYLTLRGKSFKSTDENIIKRGAESYSVRTHLSDFTTHTVHYKRAIDKRVFIVDDKQTKRLPVKHRYPIVLFEPDDLNLIHSSPTRRRNFIDNLVCQVDPFFNKSLIKYDKSLKQRNAILKDDNLDRNRLFPWDVAIAKYGSEITATRHEYIDRINQRIEATYHSISNNPDQISLRYNGPSLNESEFLQELDKNFYRDHATGFTSFGPHRDDITISFNTSLASESASRGETRSIVLALKFIEAELIQEQLGHSPLILLDDIFSELDETRQTHLITNFKNHQTIITSVTIPDKKSKKHSINVVDLASTASP